MNPGEVGAFEKQSQEQAKEIERLRVESEALRKPTQSHEGD